MAGRFEKRLFTKANIQASGQVPVIPKQQFTELTTKKAPPEIPYTNPANYLSYFESSDGKLNLVAIGGAIVGAWLLLRLLNRA